jgi:hypothetical protein
MFSQVATNADQKLRLNPKRPLLFVRKMLTERWCTGGESPSLPTDDSVMAIFRPQQLLWI